MGSAAETHREVEAKYDVDQGWAMPSLAGLVPGGSVPQETLRLTSTYYDTAGRDLLQARLTLRRRTGDADTGWQLKVPDGQARTELRWPLGTGRAVPAELRELTLGVRGRAGLAPVATVDVRRQMHRLIDADGVCLAEVVLDTVTSSGPAGSDTEPATWREVEVELVDGRPRVLRQAGEVLRAAGARPSASSSKLARALGVATRTDYRHGTLAAVVAGYLDTQYEAIVLGDLSMRRGEYPVHATRTAIRRYRSVLRVLAEALDAERAAALDEELRALALVLGEVRDNEVLRDYLTGLLAELPAEVEATAAADRLDQALATGRERAVAAVDRHLRSTRHLDLMAELAGWHRAVPIDPARPAADALRFVKQSEKRSRRRLAAVPEQYGPDDERMHRARKAAKRTRYVAELAQGPGVGDAEATRTAREVERRNKRVQGELGDRQDSVIAAAFLLGLAGETAGPAGFALGVLYQLARDRAEG